MFAVVGGVLSRRSGSRAEEEASGAERDAWEEIAGGGVVGSSEASAAWEREAEDRSTSTAPRWKPR